MAINALIPLQGKVSNANQGINQLIGATKFNKAQEAQAGRDEVNERATNARIAQINQGIAEAGRVESVKDYAGDVLHFANLMESGDVEGARTAAQQRIQRLTQGDRGTDTGDTQQFLDLMEQDPRQAYQYLQGEARDLGRLGYIESVAGKDGKTSNHVNAPVLLENDAGELIYAFPTINKDTLDAQLKPADVPEGFRPVKEAPDTKRNKDLLAAQQKEINKLTAKAEAEPGIQADIAEAKNAVERSEKAFASVDNLRNNVTNLEQALGELRSGAGTGAIEQWWPSFRAASVALDSTRGRLGLDIVQATTFGALSKGELDLSKDIALPVGLDEPELEKWIVDRINAQNKKADYLERQAIFLGNKNDEGKRNTSADWFKAEKEAMNAALGAFDVTDADIKETMRANDMSRSAVLTEIRRRHESGGP